MPKTKTQQMETTNTQRIVYDSEEMERQNLDRAVGLLENYFKKHFKPINGMRSEVKPYHWFGSQKETSLGFRAVGNESIDYRIQVRGFSRDPKDANMHMDKIRGLINICL